MSGREERFSQGGAVRETTCVASSESVESFLLKDGMVHAVLLAHDVSTRKTHVGHRGAMVFMGWISKFEQEEAEGAEGSIPLAAISACSC